MVMIIVLSIPMMLMRLTAIREGGQQANALLYTRIFPREASCLASRDDWRKLVVKIEDEMRDVKGIAVERRETSGSRPTSAAASH
jgi:hypothetical protein